MKFLLFVNKISFIILESTFSFLFITFVSSCTRGPLLLFLWDMKQQCCSFCQCFRGCFHIYLLNGFHVVSISHVLYVNFLFVLNFLVSIALESIARSSESADFLRTTRVGKHINSKRGLYLNVMRNLVYYHNVCL